MSTSCQPSTRGDGHPHHRKLLRVCRVCLDPDVRKTPVPGSRGGPLATELDHPRKPRERGRRLVDGLAVDGDPCMPEQTTTRSANADDDADVCVRTGKEPVREQAPLEAVRLKARRAKPRKCRADRDDPPLVGAVSRPPAFL